MTLRCWKKAMGQPVHQTCYLLNKRWTTYRKKWMTRNKAAASLSRAYIQEANFDSFNKIYKMIGGYDVEAQVRARERDRVVARSVLTKISKEERNEKRRLKHIKERVSKTKSDAFPELMRFMMQNEVRRREKAELAKSKAKGRATSKAYSCKCGTLGS